MAEPINHMSSRTAGSTPVRQVLGAPEREVFEAACEVIKSRFTLGRHHVGAAVRAASGKIYTGIHLQGVIGEPAVCAEKIAIGRAMTAGEEQIDMCVAVRHPKPREEGGRLFVLPPCGSCREMIGDYGGRDVRVILEVDGALVWMTSAALLPYRRWHRGAAPAE